MRARSRKGTARVGQLPEPRRILLVRTDRIGELLLTTPAFSAVRESFTGAKIDLMVRPSSSPVVEGNPSLDSIIKIDPDSDLNSFAKRLKFIRRLAASGFDMAIIFNPNKFLNIAVFLAGIPVRVGYDRKLGFLLTHAIEDKKHLCEKHEVEYDLDLARAAGACADGKGPCFPLSESDERNAEKILKENGIKEAGACFVAIHPSTSNPEKAWPAEKFAEVSDMVMEKFRASIVIVGGGGERGIADRLKSKARNKVIDLTGKLSLKELGAVLKKASLLISCDSGPVHVASAVETPVVALFGESRPGGSSKRWGPYGRRHVVVGKPKVTDITVGEVFEAASGILCKRR